MFDISFSELVVIAVVALIVIGPEKLPKIARTLGALMGRMQKYAAQIKEEVNREARFEELQQLQQEIKNVANQTQSSLQNAAQGMTQQVEALEMVALNQEAEVVLAESDDALEAKPALIKPVRKKSLSKINLSK
ncbi:MAG: twin-arginine translocase subunit TatB [Methylotenera sp.]|nr:twin-arginine translocase subunit TatB [Methylotenera sp.]